MQQPIDTRDPNPGEAPTLFERIGGREVVVRIVDDFYARIEADQEMRALFPADMAPGRAKQALFMEQWLGGAPSYSERYGHPRLRRRHFPFRIEERHAGRWLHHMTDALRANGVSDADVAEILAGLGPLAHHMVNASEDVPREPMGDVRLT